MAAHGASTSAEDEKEKLMLSILKDIDTLGGIKDSLEYCKERQIDHKDVFTGAMKSLKSMSLVSDEKVSLLRYKLSDEALEIIAKGSPEAILLASIPKEGIEKSKLEEALGKNVVARGWTHAMRLKWITFDKKSGKVTKKADIGADKAKELLATLQAEVAKESDVTLSKADVDYLKKRTLVSTFNEFLYRLSKGPKFSLTLPVYATDLTSKMVATGEWQDVTMKSYNLHALGAVPACGHLHPLMKVRSEYRQIFLEMGFQEMRTNQFVESSFWNFDALFQPQQHPAREAHDTFFISEPATCKNIPADYLARVKKMHESGGEGSIGWRYDWSEEESRKNILRTHTTAVSSRTLYDLAQNGFKPGKYFSIDRVYRNEAMDATHLAEFHQVEGMVVDRGLTLGNLIGVIRQFFNYLGITQIKFKPAYNPYTEPSMEVFSYHSGLKKWVEVGNSGIFRPEMLRPMGLPEDVVVIAWGLSLERPTMIKYGINNIRELVGHKLDLNFVHTHPIVRLDK